MVLTRLRSVPKNYDWGLIDAFSSLAGGERQGIPEAELWFGDHQFSQCFTGDGDSVTHFGDWLSSTGQSFPYLVKLLAAAKPLSVQIHPDSQQAAKGFGEEEAQRIGQDDPRRSYKDPSGKPELLIALSDEFDLLWGFCSPEILSDRLEAWAASGLEVAVVNGLADLFALPPTEAAVACLSGFEGSEDIIRGITAWSTREQPETALGAVALEREVFTRLAQHHPGDAGILFATLMHVVRLSRGESVFIQPGEVHSYVRGFGLEVMMPSDNVFRAALTTKRRDLQGFLATMAAQPSAVGPFVVPTLSDDRLTYRVAQVPFVVRELRGPITFVPESHSLIIAVDSVTSVRQGDSHIELTPATAAFVGAGGDPVALAGAGSVWVVETA